MYGIMRGDIGFYYSIEKEFKKPCLWVERGNVAYKVGQFSNEETAKAFLEVINFVCFNRGVKRVNYTFDEWERGKE